MTYFSSQVTTRSVEFGLLILLVAVPLLTNAGMLDRLYTWFGTPTSASEPSLSIDSSLYQMDMGYLRSVLNSDPVAGRGGGSLAIEDGALLAQGPIGADAIATSGRTNGEISVYTVREGDSLSQIAEMYNVTSNTILWANDLSSATAIRPGDTLVILPIAGVQHTVASGDTVAALAKKYEGDVDEILAYNQLSNNSQLKAGDTLVIPGGRIAQAPPPPAPSRPTPTRSSGAAASSAGQFTHPAPGTVRTQGLHGYNAVDYGGAIGTPILAAAAGEVIVSRNSGWNGGYGNYVVIRHPNGVQTLYAHNNSNLVGVGEYVQAGQQIATMGNTGRSTGPHLHFEVRGARNPF